MAMEDPMRSDIEENESVQSWDLVKEQPWIRIVIYLVYGLVSVIGMCGNGLVVHVVLRKKAMHTITNVFILNLALANLLMSSIAAPITPVAFFMDQWDLPAVLCQILPMTMAVSVYVSTWISLAVALDRYLVIVHPFTPRMSKACCLLVNVGVWFMACLLSSPYAVHHKYVFNESSNASDCTEIWHEERFKRVFDWSSFVLQFVIPSVVIAYSYHRVSRVLSLRHLTKQTRGILTNSQKEERELRRKQRTTRMLIAMVTIFVLSWIPLNVFVLQDASQNLYPKGWPYANLLFFLCHGMAMSSAIYNPFLYGWMNENFRNEFHSVLPWLVASPNRSG